MIATLISRNIEEKRSGADLAPDPGSGKWSFTQADL